jgi:hypothetical protein
MILLEEAQGEGHGAWYRLLSGVLVEEEEQK